MVVDMLSLDQSEIAPTLTDTAGNIVSIHQIQEYILELQQWLIDNQQINACPEIGNLSFFLHSAKYNIELAKKKIVSFYHMRAIRTEWFSERDPFHPDVQQMLNMGVFLPVDGVDIEQRKVVIVRTAVHDPKFHQLGSVFKASMMVLDLLLKFEPENCSRGIVTIFDMKGVSLGHALQLKSSLIKRLVDSWQTYPCQPKRFEFINAPLHVNFVLNTFRFFMTPKMRKRVFIQRNDCSVQSINLPNEISGQGDITYDQLIQKWKGLVEQNVDFFKEYDKYKSLMAK